MNSHPLNYLHSYLLMLLSDCHIHNDLESRSNLPKTEHLFAETIRMNKGFRDN